MLLLSVESVKEMAAVFDESLNLFEDGIEWFRCSGLKLMAVVGEELGVDGIGFSQ